MATENPTALPGTDPKLFARFLAKVRIGEGCWEWTAAKDAKGYGHFGARDGQLAHRTAWRVFVGEIPPNTCVLHRCDNPPCVRPDHLWLGSQADNSHDRDTKNRGVQKHGVEHPIAKLTDDEVREIRRLHSSGTTQLALAARFGVHCSRVNVIVRGMAWRHLL